MTDLKLSILIMLFLTALPFPTPQAAGLDSRPSQRDHIEVQDIRFGTQTGTESQTARDHGQKWIEIQTLHHGAVRSRTQGTIVGNRLLLRQSNGAAKPAPAGQYRLSSGVLLQVQSGGQITVRKKPGRLK